MEVFAVNHGFPFSKMLTFYRKEPFDLEASYGKNVNLPLKDGFIGKLKLMIEGKCVMTGFNSKGSDEKLAVAVLVILQRQYTELQTIGKKHTMIQTRMCRTIVLLIIP